MSDQLSVLEQNILKAKGLSEEQVAALPGLGVATRGDFATVGNTETLLEIMPGLDPAVAQKVMEWALGRGDTPNGSGASGGSNAGDATGRVVLDTSDAVYCVHCQGKQPKDYSSGDLCVNCGKQAEPTESCYWCASSGPGKFCRSCGATFVPTAELDLAVLLRRDGLPKDDIPKRLSDMTAADKDALWGRVRHSRT